MEFRIIKSPTQGTIDIIQRRKGSKIDLNEEKFDAVALVQGKLIDMIFACDIAEKSAGVMVEELRGSCPQNMIAIAIFGDTASVENALEKIQDLSLEKKR